MAAWSWTDFAGLGLIFHIILMIVMTWRIVSVQRNIGVAIAWIAVLFTLPIDVALMMVKQKEIGQEMSCDINSIPFMPAEARVNSMTIQINFLIFYLGTTEYSIEIK